MTRHLVLGGCGFIGRHLALALARRGDPVVVADIMPPPPELGEAGIEYRAVEPGEPAWEPLIDGCEVIHHYAWTTVPATANDDPLGDLDANLRNTVRLLETLRREGGRRLLFSSSGGTVYGRLTQTPVPETHAFAPITAYGASKAAAEIYMGFYHGCHGLDCRVARISNPFGAGQDPRRKQGAASAFLFQTLAGEEITIWGDGSVVRDYIHIADLVEGLLAVADAPVPTAAAAAMPVYNIGSGVGVSLNGIVDVLRSRLHLDPTVTYLPGRPFDVPVSVLDISRAAVELNWRPRLSFADGCARMLADLRRGQTSFSTLLD
ncbi:NAD-dependent epimerase/dehydratase family protein [Caenispirillum bisanense]|uniref:UDP-glucose 4-epimerase n=1 Tax=Caenispirillum bisanense TaxID=414052 RepID=A0A286GTL0_9PROT|nr:NAD-dependent epimerase/dehydratase family protein [Caenispirillum bisanense]SOD98782.1 UDP-glucose 4-epimerase [Caenispirillum bisanense]